MQDKVNEPTREFYRTALPAFPILVIAFLCREGAELVCILLLIAKAVRPCRIVT